MPANPIYKFHAELMNTDLKVWREFEVVNNYPMSKFGYIVMSLFRMKGNHLWTFEVPYKENEKPKIDVDSIENVFERNAAIYAAEVYRIEIPNPYNDFAEEVKCLDATKTKISKIITEVGENIVFNYDFGDNWEIKLILKEIYIDNKIHGREFPRVLDGEGYGIIEDCGGVGGLENLIQAFELKSGEEYEEYSQWIGKQDIDFKSFDKRYFAMIAKNANAIFKDAYENIDN